MRSKYCLSGSGRIAQTTSLFLDGECQTSQYQEVTPMCGDKKVNKGPHPPCLPDIAPSDCYLFGTEATPANL
jgi:hypothetical protein